MNKVLSTQPPHPPPKKIKYQKNIFAKYRLFGAVINAKVSNLGGWGLESEKGGDYSICLETTAQRSSGIAPYLQRNGVPRVLAVGIWQLELVCKSWPRLHNAGDWRLTICSSNVEWSRRFLPYVHVVSRKYRWDTCLLRGYGTSSVLRGSGLVPSLHWGSPKASHIKANQPHFPHFHVRISRIFAPWNLLRPLFFLGWEGPSAFSAFSPYQVRIADFKNPTDRLYYDRPWVTGTHVEIPKAP